VDETNRKKPEETHITVTRKNQNPPHSSQTCNDDAGRMATGVFLAAIGHTSTVLLSDWPE